MLSRNAATRSTEAESSLAVGLALPTTGQAAARAEGAATGSTGRGAAARGAAAGGAAGTAAGNVDGRAACMVVPAFGIEASAAALSAGSSLALAPAEVAAARAGAKALPLMDGAAASQPKRLRAAATRSRCCAPARLHQPFQSTSSAGGSFPPHEATQCLRMSFQRS